MLFMATSFQVATRNTLMNYFAIDWHYLWIFTAFGHNQASKLFQDSNSSETLMPLASLVPISVSVRVISYKQQKWTPSYLSKIYIYISTLHL